MKHNYHKLSPARQGTTRFSFQVPSPSPKHTSRMSKNLDFMFAFDRVRVTMWPTFRTEPKLHFMSIRVFNGFKRSSTASYIAFLATEVYYVSLYNIIFGFTIYVGSGLRDKTKRSIKY